MRKITFNPFDGVIEDEAINRWMEQFEPDETNIISKIVENFNFYSVSRVNNSLKLLHNKIISDIGSVVEDIWYVPVGYVAKSGSLIAYLYKTQNGIDQDRFISSEQINTLNFDKAAAIIFLDDYIGTGHQARLIWEGLISQNPHITKMCKIGFAVIIANESGISHLEKRTGFHIFASDVVRSSDSPLSETSSIFISESERNDARRVLMKYGQMLYPNSPFGYGNAEGMLGFFYSTPNTTFPMFWAERNNWKPLLPRKDSFRDPADLIGPPAGFSKNSNRISTSHYPFERTQIRDYTNNMPNSEISSRIISEFRNVGALFAIGPAVKRMGFDARVFASILDAFSKLRDCKIEGKSPCTSLLIVDEGFSRDSLRPFFAFPNSDMNFDLRDDITSLARFISGSEGAIVITNKEKLLGCVPYRGNNDHSYPFLPFRYRKAARASLETNGLLFFSEGNGRASIFCDGDRILVSRGHDWYIQPSNLNTAVRELAEQYGINFGALHMLFRVAFYLSDLNEGALLTIGDHQTVLDLSEAQNSRKIGLAQIHIQSTSAEVLMGLMCQDGATVVSAGGELIQAMTSLRPPPNAPGKIDPRRGTRHSTAAKITGVTKCICLAVSVSGTITVYGKGDILIELMG